MPRLKLFVPLLAFVIMAGLFAVMIKRIERGDYNPQALPSALLNKPVPVFSLGTVEAPVRELGREALLGQIALVNVWATWCPSCHAEHGYLTRLAEQGVRIIGVNYKDDRDKARQWLAEKGNPYTFNLFDPEGRLGLDFGVTGAPETYLIDHRGFVRWRYQGPLDERVWQQQFVPMVEQLQQEQRESER